MFEGKESSHVTRLKGLHSQIPSFPSSSLGPIFIFETPLLEGAAVGDSGYNEQRQAVINLNITK